MVIEFHMGTRAPLFSHMEFKDNVYTILSQLQTIFLKQYLKIHMA